ncbi:kinase A anchor protein [Xylaria intraflava]|nr:kinase A anchor protein [Xylaria intraflava]
MPPRPHPTHFLCIPLCTVAGRRQLSASLSSFRLDVTSPESFGVPEQAIRPVGTLHLTLGVMSFPKNEGLEKAVALLKSILPRQILADLASSAPTKQSNPGHPVAEAGVSAKPSASLMVSLRGLRTLQPAAKSSMLYAAPLDVDGTLTAFCERLRSVFRDAGLLGEDSRPLLLHATVLNTIYVKDKGASRRGGKHGEKLTIDARRILDRYEDYVWMENVPVEKIAICRMGAKKLDDGDAAYEVEAEIDVE